MQKQIWYSSSHRHSNSNKLSHHPSKILHDHICLKPRLCDRICITCLGLTIGFIFALFIAYHIHFNAISYPILFLIPLMMGFFYIGFIYIRYAYKV